MTTQNKYNVEVNWDAISNEIKERELAHKLAIRTAFEIGWLTCKDYWEINVADDYLNGDFDKILEQYMEDQS